MNVRTCIIATLTCLCLAPQARAGDGPFGIDHRVAYDNHGIWSRSTQSGLSAAVGLTAVGGALWEGRDDPLGKTLWQSVDAMAISAVSTTTLKWAFSRKRPSETADPDAFFAGHGHASFPSGEVAQMAAAVSPVVFEYGRDHPWVYALELLPAYDMVARVKVRGHWQSDVIAGFAIGTAVGWYAHRRSESLIVGVLPDGVTIGWKKRF